MTVSRTISYQEHDFDSLTLTEWVKMTVFNQNLQISTIIGNEEKEIGELHFYFNILKLRIGKLNFNSFDGKF